MKEYTQQELFVIDGDKVYTKKEYAKSHPYKAMMTALDQFKETTENTKQGHVSEILKVIESKKK